MSRRAALLAEMGIAPIWKLRSKETPVEVPVRGWIPLKAAVSGCTKCGLHKTRAQTVFGVGDENADWMLIGEAPGAEEDRLGDPFVGQAGKLLDNMLAAIGLTRRKNVYIANVLKCRPPGNRNPTPEEEAQCSPHLLQQNTKPTVTEFMWRAVRRMHEHDPKVGLLTKSAAENHIVIQGNRYSVDAFAYAGVHDRVVDILLAAGDGPGILLMMIQADREEVEGVLVEHGFGPVTGADLASPLAPRAA